MRASYDGLIGSNRILDRDYKALLKVKHDQTNLLCQTIAEHTLLFADLRKSVLELKDGLSTQYSWSSKSSPATLSSTDDLSVQMLENLDPPQRTKRDLSLKMEGILRNTLGGESCTF